jgi:hypothetical protein
MSTTSPNMSLIIPTVGVDVGPTYAFEINQSLGLIDQHDHSPGKGMPISSEGITIVSDINMNGYAFNNLKSLTLSIQTANSIPATVFVKGVDLYYTDVNGSEIRLTKDSGVNGTPGSINNLFAPASVDYVPSSSTFVFSSNTNIAANLDIGSIKFRNLLPNSTFALSLLPPSALSSNYSITLPTLPASTSMLSIGTTGIINTNIKTPTIPGSTKIVQLDSTGQLLSTLDVDNNTINIIGNELTANANKLQQSNIIINGALDFWQRGITQSISISTSTNGSFYLADRFVTQYSRVSGPNINLSINRDGASPDSANLQYSIKATSTSNSLLAGNNNYVIPFSQRIEGNFTLGIQSTDTLYLSFYFISNHVGTFPIRMRIVDSSGASFRNYVTSFTNTSANTWELIQKTIVLPGFDFARAETLAMFVDIAPTGGPVSSNLNTWTLESTFNVAGSVQWTGNNGLGANGYVAMTGLMLNNQAFQQFNRAGKNIANEFSLCQRYYTSLVATAGAAYPGTGAQAYSPITYMVPMRTTPTANGSTLIANNNADGGAVTVIDNKSAYFIVSQVTNSGNFASIRLIIYQAEL